jgi:hypothetical protein
MTGRQATAGHKQRWSESFSDPSGQAFAAIVNPGIELDGSIFARPVHGRDDVWTTLRAAPGIYDSLTFTSDAASDRRFYLEWTATALGMPVQGVTILAIDDQNRFASVAIHHRPLAAVLAFSAELGSAWPPGPAWTTSHQGT